MSTALNKKLSLLVNGPKKKQDKLEVERNILSARFLSEIQIYLDANGLTRKELAKRTGVSASFISQLFTAEKTLSLDFIVKVQRALDIEFRISTVGRVSKHIPGTSHLHKIKNEIETDLNEALGIAAEPETTYKKQTTKKNSVTNRTK